ncbi:peptide chain release factor N(5)-glutamine methyltransferase [Gracilinema caldarium]|uniref:Release factor glutamine methyltransferase n=1 Tax=Gracilinema caldarium (strain ATCC 51460 / DSM 7334 / H1) TaxID=744872 RepID=F8EYK7_GRAC1|nr:peptide chain release factor N(5)-glutamine methyltransferase [Gracilinema caldarium]AEJ18584.1 protein-(glutamine-N5) methyltransferase, release factor-specific [Gracilinema caldarium DSM 7334]
MTIGALRAAGVNLLRQHGVESPELDASLLLAHLLQKDRTWLVLNQGADCDTGIEAQYFSLLSKRTAGFSVAYITGVKEFMGLDFTVSPAVLVPRPDTEILVENALSWLTTMAQQKYKTCKVLDLCTGSGCIGISLAYYHPDIELTLADISQEALSISRINGERILGPEKCRSIQFVQSDLLAFFLENHEQFDLIVTNPPYVPRRIIPNLAQEIQQEPYIALDGGEDGLDLIRILITQAKELLVGEGALFIESDPEQIGSIQELLKNNGFHAIESYPDLSGSLRCTRGIRLIR